MLRTPGLDGLRTQLAPRVLAAAEGANNFLHLLIILFVDEHGVHASVMGKMSVVCVHMNRGEDLLATVDDRGERGHLHLIEDLVLLLVHAELLDHHLIHL